MDFILLIPFFFTSHLILNSAQASGHSSNCCPFYCGTMGIVGYPFSNSTNPDCGLYEMKCFKQKGEVQFRKEGKRYQVERILYKDSMLRIRDTELESCDALNNFASPSSEFLSLDISSSAYFLKCNHEQSYMSRPEIFGSFSNFTGCSDYVVYYSTDPNSILPSETIHNRCSTIKLPAKIPVVGQNESMFPWGSVFYLHWKVDPLCDNCYNKGGHCVYNNKTIQCNGLPEGSKKMKNVIIGIIEAGTLAALITMATILIWCWLRKKLNGSIILWKKKSRNGRAVEAFFKDCEFLAPRRFKYKDIKRMTNSFNDIVGQGGFGSVFKGKLPDGHMVAVKVLNETKGDGNDFINEVASISRTSHVNIVTLLGFCINGPKKALVYEFMPNGSLEKFIYGERPLQTRHLGWVELYRVAIGIARGLEYLHRGCNTRIVHFDIKPHNILLDENFIPKIADFGLSKLSNVTQSIVSMTGARGTPGYIAPELVSRGIGEVSHKSDVYSYGMMVLEMVGGRKNIDVRVTNLSEIYFPHWIHKRLDMNEGLGLHGVTSLEDHGIARKMILVGLWCIQINPTSRPPMSKVLEMLEGSLEALQLPPKPYLSSLSNEDEGSHSSVSSL